MIISFAEFIQQSDLAQLLRDSFWLYPVVNVTHILGMILFFGALIPLDLRVLGFWRHKVELQQLDLVLKPLIVSGLLFALMSGLLLFITRPLDYITKDLFLIKIIVVILALVNGYLFSYGSAWQLALQRNHCEHQLKSQAFLSLFFWTAVVFLGRMVAYR